MRVFRRRGERSSRSESRSFALIRAESLTAWETLRSARVARSGDACHNRGGTKSCQWVVGRKSLLPTPHSTLPTPSKAQGRTLLSGLAKFQATNVASELLRLLGGLCLRLGRLLGGGLLRGRLLGSGHVRDPSTTLADVWGWPLESDVLGDSREVEAVTAVTGLRRHHPPR